MLKRHVCNSLCRKRWWQVWTKRHVSLPFYFFDPVTTHTVEITEVDQRPAVFDD